MRNIIEGAAKNNVIIELNASPYRLDIDWRFLRYAKEMGVMISINPDAHAAAGLYEILYGVGIARKGWQEKADILNTHSIAGVMDIFKNSKIPKSSFR
jgi:DNA polymerase (family X)